MKKIYSIAAMLAITCSLHVQAGYQVGDEFTHNGRIYQVVGANLITNPSFTDGLTGWKAGDNSALASGNFTVNTSGGADGGSYIVGTTNTGNGGAGSIGTGWAIQKGKTYVFSHYTKHTSATAEAGIEGYVVTSLVNAVGTAETKVVANDTLKAGDVWSKQQYVFTNTVPYAYLQFRARWLSNRLGFDDFTLAEVREKPNPTFLQALISECESMTGGKETEAFELAINTAKNHLADSTAELLNEAYSVLEERLLDYRIANAAADYIVDVTDRYVKNARFTDLLTYWTCGTIAVGNGINPIVYSHFGTSSREMELQNGSAAVADNYCTQTISNLRKGYYRFGADMLAYNKGNQSAAVTGVYLMCNDALTPVSTPDVVAGKFYVEGVVTDSSVVIGMKTVGSDATTIYMDNVTLEYMGFDASIYINSLRDQVNNYLVDNAGVLLPGVADELKKAALASETTSTNEDTLQAKYEVLDQAFKRALKSITMVTQLNTMVLDLQNLLLTYPGFPGFDAAQANLVAANGLLTSGPTDIESSQYQDLVDMINTMKSARRSYVLSQTGSASAPADFTLLIQNPSFRVAGQENIETASRTSEGWATNNVSSSGDFRTSFNQGKTCYNSWSDNFTSMDLYQKMAGLPAGIYAVKCLALTQEYDLNDQHAYISSSASTAVSPNMTTATWVEGGAGEWEAMQTRKVILLAGDTLRFGFASTHNSAAVTDEGAARGQNGWFNVTDFQLFYYGTEGGTEIVQSDIETAEALMNTMTLQGDKAKVAADIASAKTLNASSAAIADIYKPLLSANKLAAASITGHKNFLAGSYKKLSGMAASDTLNADIDAIFTAAVKYADDSLALATESYVNLSSLETKLAGYLSYLAPQKAAKDFMATVTVPTDYTNNLQQMLADQKAMLTVKFVTPLDIANYIAALNQSMANAKISIALTKTGEQDMTYLIVNQQLEVTGSAAPTGWTVTTNGDALTKTGQYVDGSTTKRYFDSYKSAARTMIFSGSQVVKVPNGTYQVNALVRTPTAGAFLYASSNGVKTQVEMPLQYHQFTTTSSLGTDSTYMGLVSDTYGAIWEAAAEGSAIKLANSGKGRGWMKLSVNDVVVSNHELTIGFSSDSTFTGKAFEGTWFSVVDFTLTLKAMGDNTGWKIGDMTAIGQNKVNLDVVKVETYNLGGVRVSSLVRGFNIRKTTYSDGSTKIEKIFIR